MFIEFKKEVDFMKLYLFLDEVNYISGICFGTDTEEAKHNARDYIIHRFDNIHPVEVNIDNIVVWDYKDDDDYKEDYPYALATGY